MAWFTNEKYVSNTLIIQLAEYTKVHKTLFLLYNLPNFLRINRMKLLIHQYSCKKTF